MAEKKRLNVLYLSYDGMTDPLGESQVLPYLIGLSTKYNFTLISFEKKKRFQMGKDRINELLKPHQIKWLPQTYHKFPPIISTIWDILKMARVAKQKVIQSDIKFVHCRSYPSGLVGLMLKKKYGIKFLFDIRGFWANERVDGGLWNLSNPIYLLIYNFFKLKEIEMMTNADHIISLTYAGKDEIVSGRLFQNSTISIDENKVSIIPCAVDLDHFRKGNVSNSQQASLKESLGIDRSKKVMIYLGSLGTWYLLDEMVSFFKNWLKEFPGSIFLFVTQDDQEIIFNRVDFHQIPRSNIYITGSSRKEVPKYLSISDFGIFFIKPSYSKKASSATKMGEMMAVGLPFVTNMGVGDTEYVLENYKGGVAIDLSNYDVRTIESSMIPGTVNSKFLEEFYSLDSGIEKLFMIYNNLLHP